MFIRKTVFIIFIIFIALSLSAEIKEKELNHYRERFISKIKRDNPGMHSAIGRCMDGIVRQGSAGTRISDKFALFLYDSSRNRLSLERVRFFKQGSIDAFMIVMKDLSDGQLYNLYMEYFWSGKNKSYTLKDIYFSMVFREKMDSVRDFFGGD